MGAGLQALLLMWLPEVSCFKGSSLKAIPLARNEASQYFFKSPALTHFFFDGSGWICLFTLPDGDTVS